MVLRGEGFGRLLDFESKALIIGISVLIKKAPQNSLVPLSCEATNDGPKA